MASQQINTPKFDFSLHSKLQCNVSLVWSAMPFSKHTTALLYYIIQHHLRAFIHKTLLISGLHNKFMRLNKPIKHSVTKKEYIKRVSDSSTTEPVSH